MSNWTFPKTSRLLTSAQFQRVFQRATVKVSHAQFLILTCANQLPYARLGLVVGKKHCRLAVGRNRLKRHIRETFRHWQHHLSGIDAIVLPRQGASRLNNRELQTILNQQWQGLAARLPIPAQS